MTSNGSAQYPRYQGSYYTFSQDDTVAGRWHLVRPIGRGSFGEVWLALDAEYQNQKRVLKILSHVDESIGDLFPDETFDKHVRFFLRELQMLKKVDEARIGSVIRYFGDTVLPEQKIYCIATEYDGRLFDLGRQEKLRGFSLGARVDMLSQIASAIDLLHERLKYIHRDIKPENILVNPDGSRALLADFGIAHPSNDQGESLTTSLKVSRSNLGSEPYMSPRLTGLLFKEVRTAADDPQEQDDNYSFVITAYEILCNGDKPFGGKDGRERYAKKRDFTFENRTWLKPPSQLISPKLKLVQAQAVDDLFAEALEHFKRPGANLTSEYTNLRNCTSFMARLAKIIHIEGIGSEAADDNIVERIRTGMRTGLTQPFVAARKHPIPFVAASVVLMILFIGFLIVTAPPLPPNPTPTSVSQINVTNAIQTVVAGTATEQSRLSAHTQAALATLATSTETPSRTSTLTHTPSMTSTSTNTYTPTSTFTPTVTTTNTFTATLTATQTATNTFTPTATLTPSATATFKPTNTLTPLPTATRSESDNLNTRTAILATLDYFNTLTATQYTPTFTQTETSSFTPTLTLTYTPTNTLTVEPTNTYTSTSTYTPTNTLTFTPTFAPTNTPTSTPLPTMAPTLIGGVSPLILYNSSIEGQDAIYTYFIETEIVKRLTDLNSNNYLARWSPDGTDIAFVSDRNGDPDIYVMDANGTDVRRLTYSPSGTGADWPRWSPNGQFIMFTANWEGNHEIYIVNVLGGTATNLSRNPADDQQPNIAPDGLRVIFQSNRDTSRQQLYQMDIDGSDQFPFIQDPNADLATASFSPDGNFIAYRRKVGDVWDLMLTDAFGSNSCQITNGVSTYGLAWSPDSTLIAFHVPQEVAANIYVVSVPSTCSSQISTPQSSLFLQNAAHLSWVR